MTLSDVAFFLGVVAALNWVLAAFAAFRRLQMGAPPWPATGRCGNDLLACPARMSFYLTSKAHILNARAAIWSLVTGLLFLVIRYVGIS